MKVNSGCFYVLMLVYVGNDWKDIAGNKYLSKHFVEAKSFTRDIDIRHGLSGIPWGKTDYLLYEKIDKGHWLVVKTELSEDIIKINDFYNRYKFKNGMVVHSGDICSSFKYIAKHKNRKDFMKEALIIKPKEIAGSSKWLKKYNTEIEV